MRNRRMVLLAIPGFALATTAPLLSQTVQGKVPRIGILIAESVAGQADRLAALRAGLADVGYLDGRTVAFEIRSAEGHYDRLDPLARELVEAKVDVLVAFGIKALSAAKAATGQIPLVIPATSSDLLALGLINSLARPGGNITGSTTFGSEVMAKRLEIVKDVLPRAGRVAVLVNPANSGSGPMFHKLEVIARALKLELQKYELRKPDQLASTFASISRARMDAVVVQDDTLFAANARALVDHAARYRLPVIGGRDLVEAGGLVGFGRNELELYRASARYVDRILKGESPGDLPIDQAMRFALWLNGGAAKALGIAFPEAIRMRADNVIQ